MADKINIQDINALHKVVYEDIRWELRSGDLFFASGDYWVSKAIQKMTCSPWSHVGIVVRIDALDRVLLLESVEDMGVRFAPLSKYLKDYEHGQSYEGRIVFARSSDVTQTMADSLSTFGMDELTQPYDKDEIVKIMARVILGVGKQGSDREYICSELVYECFARAGKVFSYNVNGFISPEDIWRDSSVNLIHRVL